jgi:hypothetical protein
MATVYFHSPCFDGIASAVLTADFLRTREGAKRIRFEPVNYDLRNLWLLEPLRSHAAVVDFLYHPQARFWADHHATTFLTPEAMAHFEAHKGIHLVYDPQAPSCASLLWSHLAHAFGYRNHCFLPLVSAAEKTDSAAYESPQEAVFGDSPPIRLNLSLAVGEDAQGYSGRLAALLLKNDIDAVLKKPEVSERVERAEQLMRKGLARLERALHITPYGTAVFSVASNGAIIPRYGAFLAAPRAPYSVGLVRGDRGAKITAMRNPWLEFPSIDLGRLFSRHGGGGHHRVASVILNGQNRDSTEAVLHAIVHGIESSLSDAYHARRETK